MQINWEQIESIRINQKSINIEENQSKSDTTQLEPNKNQCEQHYLISLHIYIYTPLCPQRERRCFCLQRGVDAPSGDKGKRYIIYIYLHI